LRIGRDQVVRYRARVSHLDKKLPAGSFAKAAWGGLQDSIPRGGISSLHARVEGTRPDSWEHSSLVQIWFRGGADYIVPRADVGIFTLGSLPRDKERVAELERLADDVHRVTEGRPTLLVREVQKLLEHSNPIAVRFSALTGRVHIRWDASRIWLIPAERPAIDAEDARRELARRFLHWLGPATKPALARWTGVTPRDATETWKSIEGELVAVDVGDQRFMLASDLDDLVGAEPIQGVRLLPLDDPLTKTDKELLVPDPTLRSQVLPGWGESPGYLPGAVLVDGEIVGVWRRVQRKVTVRAFTRLNASVREAIEGEALSFPIAGPSAASVTWEK
jgi:hypothetical protein